MSYTDPSGEYMHLIIGAVLGGTINLMSNWASAENFWDGLGYFSVGAVAGATGAGVGAGINATLAGGSFSTGFLSGANTTGFWAGAMSGGGTGFTSGMIQGTGNGLLGNQNISDAFMSGLDNSWNGATWGALLGGLNSGREALVNRRNFFDGSFEQYKVDRFTTENGMELWRSSKDATVINIDDYNVPYRSEDGLTGLNEHVKPGYYIKGKVDGIATSATTE